MVPELNISKDPKIVFKRCSAISLAIHWKVQNSHQNGGVIALCQQLTTQLLVPRK